MAAKLLFLLKKREKFANHNTKKKHEGVFGVLYRPEGKMLSRLSEKLEEQLVFNRKKEKAKNLESLKMTDEKSSNNLLSILVTKLQKAVKGLEHIFIRPGYLETKL